jgi:hypothetical protein
MQVAVDIDGEVLLAVGHRPVVAGIARRREVRTVMMGVVCTSEKHRRFLLGTRPSSGSERADGIGPVLSLSKHEVGVSPV